MAYPRRCPLCGADYDVHKGGDRRHSTIRTVPSGTPSPRRPDLSGSLLTLHCTVCRGEYAWDYFAGQPAAAARKAG